MTARCSIYALTWLKCIMWIDAGMVLLFRGLGLARFNHAALHCAVNASISTVALQQAQPIWPFFDGAGSQIVILQKRCEELFVFPPFYSAPSPTTVHHTQNVMKSFHF